MVYNEDLQIGRLGKPNEDFYSERFITIFLSTAYLWSHESLEPRKQESRPS
jgi:hypothetical protein